jgi:ornithine--oxo-acid transaminase
MAPIAVDNSTGPTNTSLKATARSFHPTGTPDPTRYHTTSSKETYATESKYAAHNYHPLPIVFARASGVSVWDPVREKMGVNRIFINR